MTLAPRPDVGAALAVADWRRRVHGLYEQVREAAASDPAQAHALWCAQRDELFAHHPASPLPPMHRTTFTGLSTAPYDPRYRFVARVEPLTEASTSAAAGSDDDPADAVEFVAHTGTDGDVPYRRVGSVRLATPAGEARLAVWQLQSYGGGLFVPVRDATCGRTAYGGGRYVLDTVKGADLGPGTEADTVVLDLNFAYNPSCAYDPHWACPLPPAASTTAVPLPVGEQHRGPWVLA